MNERALIVAKVMPELAEVNNAHIYDDGMILQLDITSDRHLAVRKILIESMGLTFEEARIDNWSVFIFDFDTNGEMENKTVGLLCLIAGRYNDHKWHDTFTVNGAIELFKPPVTK